VETARQQPGQPRNPAWTDQCAKVLRSDPRGGAGESLEPCGALDEPDAVYVGSQANLPLAINTGREEGSWGSEEWEHAGCGEMPASLDDIKSRLF
jgi:hypothetical protein